MVGPSYTEILEENLIQFVVVILPGMDQNLPGQSVEPGNHQTHLDEFRSGAEHGQDLAHRRLRQPSGGLAAKFTLDVVEGPEQLHQLSHAEASGIMARIVVCR
jgi:hypothetical protein